MSEQGNGMERSNFMVTIDVDSLTRIMQDRDWYHQQHDAIEAAAERADKRWEEQCNVWRTKYQALRNALHMAAGYAQETLTDSELVHVVSGALTARDGQIRDVTPRRLAALPDCEGTLDGTVLPVAPAQRDGEPFGEPFRLERVHPVEGEQDGPPTQSMLPVEEPPGVPEGYSFGRVLTRGMDLAELQAAAPVRQVITRLGVVWHSHSETPGEYWNKDADTWHTLSALLHVHGMVWELVAVESADAGTEQEETAQ